MDARTLLARIGTDVGTLVEDLSAVVVALAALDVPDELSDIEVPQHRTGPDVADEPLAFRLLSVGLLLADVARATGRAIAERIEEHAEPDAGGDDTTPRNPMADSTHDEVVASLRLVYRQCFDLAALIDDDARGPIEGDGPGEQDEAF